VNILQSDSDDTQRMLQAVILNQYRQDVAAKNKINLKPIILFKAQKTIAESHENKAKFEKLIENLTTKDIENIKEKVNIPLIQNAVNFYPDLNLLVDKIQSNFSPRHLLTTNELITDEKANKNESQIQKDLNTLESSENQIRAIFTVNKLNEGWDVLNLFDIVRLYTARDGDIDKKGDYIPGKTTIAEAQLIGRGARYYPFSIDENDDKFKRKFDDDIENEMRILEEIHYHSFNEPRYISEIRATLVKEGLLDEKTFTRELKLKSEFKESTFYKTGFVLKNKQLKQDQEDQLSFENLSFKNTPFEHKVFSGKGKETKAFDDFDDFDDEKLYIQTKNKDFDLAELGLLVVKKAMQKDSFFSYSSLKEMLPELKSTDDFITLPKYLGGVKILFNGPEKSVKNPNSKEKLDAVLELLEQVKSEMRNTAQKYKGSRKFEHFHIKNIFTDKTLKLAKDIEGDEDYLKDKDWYVFKANYGTSEEKDMVKAIETKIEAFEAKYSDIYLIRNERHFKVFRFSDGQAFEPDFVLFVRSKDIANELTYQIFLEPKGNQFRGSSGTFEDGKEAEKLKFLKELNSEMKDEIKIFGTTKKYKIIGVPMFYNKKDENKFISELAESVSVAS
jgi:type III restriction enzyme